MASLLDRIEQIGAGGAQPQQSGIEKILRQRGGKATKRKGPAASSLGEQAAITAGREAIREQTFAERLAGVQARGKEEALAEQQALQEQQLRQQEELAQERLTAEAAMTREGIRAGEEESRLKRESAAERNIKDLNAQSEQKLRDLATSRGVALDDVFAQFEFDSAELEDRRDASQLEQQAFLMAMQDRRYLDELEKIGKQRQLENDIQFDSELQSIVMGQNMSNLLEDLDFKTGRAARNRDFTQQLAEIDIDAAIALAQAAIRDEATRKQWEAGGQLVTAVAQDVTSEDSAITGLFAEEGATDGK